MSNNITPQDYVIDQQKRSFRLRHRPLVLWFSGLSGSGKSTIANRVEKELFDRNIHTYSLDGDNIRRGLNKDLGFSREERKENIRRIAEVASLFHDAGTVCLAAFITPLEEDQNLVRTIIGEENLVEIFVNTSLKECERRDVKGLYKQARAGEIREFTGISAPFEIPKNPNVEINTEKETIQEAVDKILVHLQQKLQLPSYE